MIEVKFNDNKIVNRVINDLTTTKSSLKRLFIDILSDYNPSRSDIIIEVYNNNLKIEINQNIKVLNNFEEYVTNIGQVSDQIYGVNRLNYLKYLAISERIKICSGDEAYELTENGYERISNNCNKVSIELINLKEEPERIRDIIYQILRGFIPKTQLSNVKEELDFISDKTYKNKLVIDDTFFNEDEYKLAEYETDDFHATYSPDNTGGIYINNIRIESIDRNICDFVDDGGVDVHLKKDTSDTPELSPDSMNLKNVEEFVNNICDILTKDIKYKYSEYIDIADNDVVLDLTTDNIGYLDTELLDDLRSYFVEDFYVKIINREEVVVYNEYMEEPKSPSDAYRRKLPKKDYDICRFSKSRHGGIKPATTQDLFN